jgi:hypothetical protein
MNKKNPDLRSQIDSFIDLHYANHDDEDGNGILLADGFEEAFLGVGAAYYNPPCAIYDYDRCIDTLVGDDCDYEQAIEYFEFNVIGAYVGPQTPLFIRIFKKEESE